MVKDLPQVAFLGPLGTYTHQAAYETFGETVQYCDKPSIAEAFEALSPEVPFAVLPQENTIFGNVIETYDLLRSSKVGREVFICGETTLAIQHCFIVRQGTRLEDVERILSHEQALGQCRDFIQQHLPKAALESTTSTAAAAQIVAESTHPWAAICSKVCLSVFTGLELLQEGVQNTAVNATRFYILGVKDSLLASPFSCRAALRLRPTAPDFDMAHLLTLLDLRILCIDRRPALSDVLFQSDYFIEVESPKGGKIPTKEEWKTLVDMASCRVAKEGNALEVLGVW